jgi:hypothetical protein
MWGYCRLLFLGLSAITITILGNVAGQELIESDYASIEVDNTGLQYLDPRQQDAWQPHLSSFGQMGSGAINSGADIFQPQSPLYPYVKTDPLSGTAPLSVTLQVAGIDKIAFRMWELDWNGDGFKDVEGQGLPFIQITYEQPGSYAPSFTFYNEYNQIIAQAKGFLSVTGPETPVLRDIHPLQETTASLDEGHLIKDGLSDSRRLSDSWSSAGASEFSQGSSNEDTGTQKQALSVSPGGWGIFGGQQKTGEGRPPIDLGSGDWTAPKEEFSEDLDPELVLSQDRGYAPLEVSFDASGTIAIYGVRNYNYDIAWGPNDAPDDGYYLYSGPDPRWTYTFQEYGAYLVILDVEDKHGQRARSTRVVFVL